MTNSAPLNYELHHETMHVIQQRQDQPEHQAQIVFDINLKNEGRKQNLFKFQLLKLGCFVAFGSFA